MAGNLQEKNKFDFPFTSITICRVNGGLSIGLLKPIHVKPYVVIVNLPDFTASPICNLDIITDFPFSRETLADAGKHLLHM